MFGSCKVCAEKEKRITAIEAEVLFLRSLVQPPVNNSHIPDAVQEANGILDVLDQPIQVQTHSAATLEEAEAILRERDNILSGNY